MDSSHPPVFGLVDGTLVLDFVKDDFEIDLTLAVLWDWEEMDAGHCQYIPQKVYLVSEKVTTTDVVIKRYQRDREVPRLFDSYTYFRIFNADTRGWEFRVNYGEITRAIIPKDENAKQTLESLLANDPKASW